MIVSTSVHSQCHHKSTLWLALRDDTKTGITWRHYDWHCASSVSLSSRQRTMLVSLLRNNVRLLSLRKSNNDLHYLDIVSLLLSEVNITVITETQHHSHYKSTMPLSLRIPSITHFAWLCYHLHYECTLPLCERTLSQSCQFIMDVITRVQ